MTREEIFARATDPGQYDSADLDWPLEGAEPSPAMQFFRRYLRQELGNLHGKSVLDIGCGTGHLYTLFDELGAARVAGVEPSARNASLARKNHPRLDVHQSALVDARLPEKFNLAVAVMSFEHQPDLRAALRTVFDALTPGGKFYLIFGDREFHLTPRFDLRLECHPLPDGSAVVATEYPYGTIHDVIRPLEHYEEAAQREGFRLIRHVELLPTRELFEADARWREFAQRPMAHLLVMEGV